MGAWLEEGQSREAGRGLNGAWSQRGAGLSSGAWRKKDADPWLQSAAAPLRGAGREEMPLLLSPASGGAGVVTQALLAAEMQGSGWGSRVDTFESYTGTS